MPSPGRATLPLEGLQIEPEWAKSAATPASDLLHISILDAISVLLVSSRPDDHIIFVNLMRSLNCALYHACNCAEAAVILRQHPITVVVSEQALSDGNWRKVQSAGVFLPAAPEMIVLSADCGSSAEARDGGAPDILSRPLEETLIPGAVVLGYLRWRRSVQQSAAARIPGCRGASPTRSTVFPERAHLEHPWP